MLHSLKTYSNDWKDADQLKEGLWLQMNSMKGENYNEEQQMWKMDIPFPEY